MTDTPVIPKKSDARTKAEILVQMTKEAQRVERRIGAKACVVICFFEDGKQVTVQDAGTFPYPPDQVYDLMKQAHVNGQLGEQKRKSRIIRAN